MQEAGRPRRNGPPHNPMLRELVKGKRLQSAPLTPERAIKGFQGWSERGYLPHRDEPGLTQFVTFRLFDSFPVELRAEWEHFKDIENERERRREIEAYLDKGRGSCHLRNPAIAALTENSLRHFHGDRYELKAWVIMPNHVHVLFAAASVSMSRIVESWKKFVAHEANKVLHRTGSFWQADYWDTFMRDGEHALRTRRYIEANPVKAGLVAFPKDWLWSSARLRDDNGVLRV